MTTIRSIQLATTVRPMRMLFATSLGHKRAATSVLVTVKLSDGTAAVGETPTSFVLKHETVDAIKAILHECAARLVGTPIADYPPRLAAFRRQYADFHMTMAGLEVALLRASLATRGVGEHRHWGAKRNEIVTDITIPFIPDTAAMQTWLATAIRAGFATYKVKVSGDLDADIALVRDIDRTLRQRLGRYTIRLDGNQGYTATSYLKMLDRLEREKLAIELFEQPLLKDDFAGMKRLRGRSRVPVILDETVFCAADCRRVIDEDLGDGVNVKIAKSGIAESREILKLARRAGLKLMIGCMTETMVGLSAGIYLAAGTGAFDYIDLDSVHLLFHHNRYGDITLAGDRYRIES